jgi:hypothetical protein
MITEYIKRGHRKGYDEKGNLVYKVPVDAPAPAYEQEEEEFPLFEDEAE